jgi:hypothetical protein
VEKFFLMFISLSDTVGVSEFYRNCPPLPKGFVLKNVQIIHLSKTHFQLKFPHTLTKNKFSGERTVVSRNITLKKRYSQLLLNYLLNYFILPCRAPLWRNGGDYPLTWLQSLPPIKFDIAFFQVIHILLYLRLN